MTTQQDEHFSAFIDGELDEANGKIVLDRLASDSQHRQRWSRYHLISDTLQSKLPVHIHTKFSESVMAAIANEPAILAPQRKIEHSQPYKHRVAGVAIAASVAMAAVVVVQNMNQPDRSAQVAQMPASSEFVRLADQAQSQEVAQQQLQQQQIAQQQLAQEMVPQPQIVPQIFSGSPAMTVSSTQTTLAPAGAEAELDPRLHQYIVNHNQRISGGQFQGIMPYVRIVVSPGTNQNQGQQ